MEIKADCVIDGVRRPFPGCLVHELTHFRFDGAIFHVAKIITFVNPEAPYQFVLKSPSGRIISWVMVDTHNGKPYLRTAPDGNRAHLLDLPDC